MATLSGAQRLTLLLDVFITADPLLFVAQADPPPDFCAGRYPDSFFKACNERLASINTHKLPGAAPPSPVPVVFSSLVLALELLGALLRQASQ